MRIGIFALQGDVSEHVRMIKKAGDQLKMNISAIEMRNFENFDCDALVIPGGESTAMRRLGKNEKFLNFLKEISDRIPVMGTCAGLILLARNVDNEFYDSVLDIEVKRNGYGRQKESFEADVEINLGKIEKFHGIFMRAPIITKVNKGEILGYLDKKPIAVKDKNVIGLTFHPELTDDTRIYKYFLNLINK